MIISDQAFSQGNIMRRLAELESRVREMEAGRRASAAAIKDGALVVLDSGGAEQIRLGKLADGSYGLEAVDALAGRVKLSALAFGATADADSGFGTKTGLAPFDFGDLSGAAVGPSVSVAIGSSGLAIVSITALAAMSVDDDGGDAFISVDVSGATSRPQAAIAGFGHQTNVGASANVEQTLTRLALIDGLTPGTNTFTMRYGAWTFTGLASCTASFQARDLIVLPY